VDLERERDWIIGPIFVVHQTRAYQTIIFTVLMAYPMCFKNILKEI
jgi:hypothetical protein